jgi:hypothetical protein
MVRRILITFVRQDCRTWSRRTFAAGDDAVDVNEVNMDGARRSCASTDKKRSTHGKGRLGLDRRAAQWVRRHGQVGMSSVLGKQVAAKSLVPTIARPVAATLWNRYMRGQAVMCQ